MSGATPEDVVAPTGREKRGSRTKGPNARPAVPKNGPLEAPFWPRGNQETIEVGPRHKNLVTSTPDNEDAVCQQGAEMGKHVP